MVGLAGTSALATWLDAPGDGKLTVTMRLSGLVLSLFGALLVCFTLISLNASAGPPLSTQANSPNNESPTSALHTHYLQSFQTSVRFGGRISTWDLPPPPTGSARLRGRVVLDDKPAEDVALFLFLNDKYKTSTVFTDEAGKFEIALAPGVWHINQVTTERWDSAPTGRRLVLFSPLEPRLGSGAYSRNRLLMETGHAVTLPSDDDLALELELRDAIDAHWPSRAYMFGAVNGEVDVAAADLDTSVVAWRPVESAVEYEVQINRLDRKSQNRISHEALPLIRVREARLPLASLPQEIADAASREFYAIEIFAFDEHGQVLTETSGGAAPLIFSVSGPSQLAPVHSREYVRNSERLSLASELIEQKQLDDARATLNEVTDDAPRGQKLALLAAISALSGDCATALLLFERAETEGGLGCIKPAHRELCETR